VLIYEEKKREKGKVKRRENENGELHLIYGSFRRKWTVIMNFRNDCSSNMISLSQMREANDVSEVG
jgi:hypothetical protein